MPIPQNTSDELKKARPYEVNFRAYGRAQADFHDGVVVREDGLTVYAAPYQTVFNAYLPPRWSTNDCPAKLATALRLSKQTGRGQCVIPGPSANPALREHLMALGIRCGYWIPFMHRDLSEPIARGPKIDGLRIEHNDDMTIWDDHPHPYIGPMTTDRRRGMVAFHRSRCQAGSGRQIVSWLDGKPVGVTFIYRHRGSAGVYDVGTDEAYRRRGIATAVMLEVLRQARDGAVLNSASDAVGLYKKVGFTDAGRYGSYYIGKDRLAKLKV